MSKKFHKLMKEAVAAFNAIPIEEQYALRDKQRVNWVWGQMRFRYPDLTEDDIRKILGMGDDE